MASQQDFLYAEKLTNIKNIIIKYYSYSLLLPIFWNCFAFIAFFFSKETGSYFQRREKQLIILIFKYQYGIALLFTLNMVLIDGLFSYNLFGYVLTMNVSDTVCKLRLVLNKYLYCIAPCYQVVC